MAVSFDGVKRMLFVLKFLSRVCFLFFILVSLMGCASKTEVMPVRGPDDREVLEKRVREYWDMHDQSQSPKVLKRPIGTNPRPSGRRFLSLNIFPGSRRASTWTAEIKGIEIEGNRAKVAMAF